jgi:hypothetical protein
MISVIRGLHGNPDKLAGVAVHDRYANYFHPRWKNLSGHQACNAHYSDTAVMPILVGLVLVRGGGRAWGIGITERLAV